MNFFRKPMGHAVAVMGLLAMSVFTSQSQAVLPTPSEQPIQFPKYNPNLYNTSTAQPSFKQAMPASATGMQASEALPQAVPNPAITNPAITNPAITKDATQNVTQGISKQVTISVVQQGQLIPVTSASQLNSGDIIEYQAHFTNNNPDRVRSMMVTLSIPKEVELVGNMAPQYGLGSSDGYRFGYMPLRAQLNGQVQELPLSYYKALRWQVYNLGLGETTTVSYQARVK